MANDTQQQIEYKNIRLNLLVIAAFIIVILCLGIIVYISDINEFAKGAITLILGKFLSYVDGIYNFELGTTRGSKDKDAVISNLSAPIVPTVVTTDKPVGG